MAKQDNQDLTSQNIAECLRYLKENASEDGILYTTFNASIRNILRDLEDGLWVIAPYQRDFVYDKNGWRKASKVIETIILGRIIPPIVIQLTKSRDGKRDVMEIVDGQQRIKSIFKFKNNEFRLNLADEEEDELSMLDGLKYKDLPQKLRNGILDYDLVAYKLTRGDTDFAAKIFLDLNTQSVPVSKAYLLLNLTYGKVTEKVTTLLARRSDQTPEYPHIWRMFGGQMKKDGSTRKTVLNSSGEIQLRVLKTLFAFTSPTIIAVKGPKWLRETTELCKDKQSFARYGLDSFEEIATIIDDLFPLGSDKQPESERPFFGEVPKKRVEGMRTIFVEALVDILFLGLKGILADYKRISQSEDIFDLHTKMRQAFNAVKSELLLGDLNDSVFVAAKAEEFNVALERIVK